MGNKFSKIPKHAIEIWLIFNSIAQILGGGGQLGPPKLNGSIQTLKPENVKGRSRLSFNQPKSSSHRLEAIFALSSKLNFFSAN